MKFYTAHDKMGSTINAFTKLSDAKQAVRDAGGGEVWRVEVDVNAETIRQLLSGHGGYAKQSEVVWGMGD